MAGSGSKEGVYRALVEGTLEMYRQGVRERIEAPGSLADRLRAIVRGHFEYTRENPSLVRFLLGLTHDPPSSAPPTDFPGYYADVVAQIGRRIDTPPRAGPARRSPSFARSCARSGPTPCPSSTFRCRPRRTTVLTL